MGAQWTDGCTDRWVGRWVDGRRAYEGGFVVLRETTGSMGLLPAAFPSRTVTGVKDEER